MKRPSLVLLLCPFVLLSHVSFAQQQGESKAEAKPKASAAAETAAVKQDPETEKGTQPEKEAPKQDEPKAAEPLDLGSLRFRQIGPASMGGRIVDLEMVPGDWTTFYVGAASGGVWKTTNGGVTFEPIFDDQGSASIGDVAVAPSKPEIVWVGTGEHNVRNSVSYGDGVYKSENGGKTWKHMGLPKSFQIGAIAVHPEDPNVVFVGALGRLWGPSEERGLYRTKDGGETWDLVLHIDEKTGCQDVVFQPGNPNVLLAAMYERTRDGFDGNDPDKRWGPGSGLFRSTDGGDTWTRMTEGLPTCHLGRIDFDFYAKNPDVVFAIIESEKVGMQLQDPEKKRRSRGYLGVTGERDEKAIKTVTEGTPAEKAGLQAGDVITKLDDRELDDYGDLSRALRRKREGDEVTLTFEREGAVQEVKVTLDPLPTDQGERPHGTRLGGQTQNRQDRQGKLGFETGGLFRSADGGVTWERINSINPRPYYFSHVRVDPSDENYVYVCGIQLHWSKDGGKTFSSDGAQRVHSDHHAIWIDPTNGKHLLLGCDGGLFRTFDRTRTWDFIATLPLGQYYHATITNERPFKVYGGLQDNGSWGGPGELPGRSGPTNDDWFQFGSGDGFVCQVDPEDTDVVYYESQNGGMGRVNLRSRQSSSIRPGGGGVRFNWKTPFILSSHNPRIFYCAGNYVFRSWNRGDDLERISEEISLTDRGAGSAIAESPRDQDVLWVGTTDGAIHVSRDGGETWKRVDEDLPERPGPRWVSSIEASRDRTGRAYVTLDGHRSDDDEAYVYVTENYGKSWKRLTQGIPKTSTRCIREDVVNHDLLYLGTEHGLWLSFDRGKNWQRLKNNFPTVAVHEVAMAPGVPEIVLATHGRSLWAVDASGLRQITSKVLEADAFLFKPATAHLWNRGFSPRPYGQRRFTGQNPEDGAQIYYHLAEKAKDVSLKIVDLQGNTVRELRADGDAGLHRVNWALNRGGGGRGQARGTRGGQNARGGAAARAGGFRGRGRGGARVSADMYQVVLKVGDKEYRQSVAVERDPRTVMESVLTGE